MTVPRFYSRIDDAITPLLSGGIDLPAFLDSRIVSLEAPDNIEENPVHVAGFALATNLCARLYPNLRILAPPRVAHACKTLALQINPACHVQTTAGTSHGTIAWATQSRNGAAIAVVPVGWEVHIDQPDIAAIRPSNMLTSLAAAAIAVGELFRSVFAEALPAGRTRPQPATFNILTLDESSGPLEALPSVIDIGRIHLVGAGAVGQAMIYTLARLSVTGTLVVVDPEQIALTNLQRYTLTTDSDVGLSKCSLAVRALKGSRLATVCCEAKWGDEQLATYGELDTVCSAVDTEAVRIEIQASLPRRIYNAWTQPADLGWSRHEDFGQAPCLACLYWPTRAKPSQHELIAHAIDQAELRVLGYLTHRLTVDQPIRAEQIPRLPNMPVPAESGSWVERSLLADIAETLKVPKAALDQWRGKQLPDLYREGVCGGALVRTHVGTVTQDLAVPLAHQSALAGIMLAAELVIANCPELKRYRPHEAEGRLDVLRNLPQTVVRPRQRTPGCICSDVDFIEQFDAKWRA